MKAFFFACLILSGLALARSRISYVNTRIGGGGGSNDLQNVQPGPQVPFGLLRLSPDTSLGFEPYKTNGQDGYVYHDTHIEAFSHTHCVGAGLADFQNFGVTVIRGNLSDSIIANNTYRSSFSHDTEVSVPGYYAVDLDLWNTRAEMTVAGTHAGVHRYTCRRGADPRSCTVLFDICHSSWATQTKIANYACVNATITHLEFSDTPGRATLGADMFNWGGFSDISSAVPLHMYFRAEVEAHGATSGKTFAFKKSGQEDGTPTCWKDNKLSPAGSCPINETSFSKSLGVLLTPDTPPTQDEDIIITVRSVVSFIGQESASGLMNSQLWNQSSNSWKTFDGAREETQELWENVMRRVDVDTSPSPSYGGSSSAGNATDPLISYFSSVYRIHLAPTIYTENGQYIGELNRVHNVPDSSYDFMSDFSIWDIFRTQQPLLMILEPKVARNIAWSMLEMWNERGFLPMWVLGNMETFNMVGLHSSIILSDFIRKGLKGLNNTAIYEALVAGIGKQNDEKLMPHYYQPWDHQYGSGSNTLDYAYDATAVYRLALFMNDSKTAEEFYPFATAWMNVWNHERKIFCPKFANGTWRCPFLDWGPPMQHKYVEDNSGEYRWWVVQNLTGLINLWPSSDDYAQHLNDFFVWGQLWPLNPFGVPDWWFWAGNEPDMMTPIQFPAAGNQYAWLTDKWMGQTLREYYQPHPDWRGIPGNDDYGAMSGFEMMGFIGIEPVAGTDDYVIFTPFFRVVNISISADGAEFSPFPAAAAKQQGQKKSHHNLNEDDGNNDDIRVMQIRSHGHPGTAAMWEAANHLNGGANNNSWWYVANATINGRRITSRTVSQQQLVEGLAAGEMTVIDLYLSTEITVFGEPAPSAGGPKPFIPASAWETTEEFVHHKSKADELRKTTSSNHSPRLRRMP